MCLTAHSLRIIRRSRAIIALVEIHLSNFHSRGQRHPETDFFWLLCSLTCKAFNKAAPPPPVQNYAWCHSIGDWHMRGEGESCANGSGRGRGDGCFNEPVFSTKWEACHLRIRTPARWLLCGVKSQIQAAVRPTTFRGSTRVERSIHFLQSPHLNAHYQMRRQPWLNRH